jgi:hypothetical protein
MAALTISSFSSIVFDFLRFFFVYLFSVSVSTYPTCYSRHSLIFILLCCSSCVDSFSQPPRRQ